jgi:HlyD family secretion protein
MTKPSRKRSSQDDKIVHLSPVPSKDRPLSRLARRYGELERTELLPEVLSYSLYGLLALLLCALAWTVFAHVEVVAVAPAKLIPTGHVKVIQPDIDGVIESIAVAEGQRVATGTVLAILEPSRSRAELDKRDAGLNIARSDVDTMARAKAGMEAALANPGIPPLQFVDVDGSARAVAELNSAYVQLREAELDSKIIRGFDSDKASLSTQSVSLSEQKNLQQTALGERSEERKSRLAQKRLELDQLRKSLESAKVELGQAKLIFDATTQQEESFRCVFQQGAVSRVDYLKIVKEVQRARRDVTRQESVVEELTKEIGIAECQLRERTADDKATTLEKRAQIKSLDFEMGKLGALKRDLTRKHALALTSFQTARSRTSALLTRLTAALDERRQKLREAEAHLRLADRDLSATQIVSPVSGTVTGIRLRGKGHVVRRGEKLMSVVPEGAALVFDAVVANKDAGFVEAGQDVKIKLTAYPFEDFGVLNGKVTHVEATSESANSSYFVAKVVPTQQFIMVRGEKRPLVSGMTASCEIVTRNRPVVNILFEPLRRMQESRWQ